MPIFGEPQALFLLLLAPVLALLLVMVRVRRKRLLSRIGQEDLIRRLLQAPGRGRWVLQFSLLLIAVLFLTLSLSRPQWGRRVEEVTRKGVDVIAAIDVSSSMLAEDVQPNRLTRAREVVYTLMDSLGGDRIGLVAFSGEARVVCPLTLDYSAAKLFLDVLDPSWIPLPGTAIAEAIQKAIETFESPEPRDKLLVLITDGEDHEGDAVARAREAAAEGVVIYTLGVGTGAGSPIPERGSDGTVSGYKQDPSGKLVTSRLDPLTLAEIAEAAGGKFLPATPEGREIQEIQQRIAEMDRREIGSRLTITYEERYQLPLGVALLALLLEAGVGTRLYSWKRKENS